jgi:hypothetical protein
MSLLLVSKGNTHTHSRERVKGGSHKDPGERKVSKSLFPSFQPRHT